jgi:hypothetical protein
MLTTSDILNKLSKVVIVVGLSAAGVVGNDIDLLVAGKAWPVVQKIAKASNDKDSAFPYNWKIWDTNVPLDIFVVWYGPSYEELVKKKQYCYVELLGVRLRAITKNSGA